MISISTLKEYDRGRYVIYSDTTGNKERGRIKSWNNIFVFVVYNCDENWDNYRNYTAAATRPQDLTWQG